MDAGLWEVPLGLDADFEVLVEAVDPDTGVVGPVVFAGTEPFTTWLWQGDDLAPIAGVLTASWTGGDPAGGKFLASVSGAATASMTSDYFRRRIAVTMTSGRLFSVDEGWISLLDAPGTGTAPAVYCSLQDVVDVCGSWLLPLMQDGGKSSFYPERARASRRLDKAILARSRPMTLGGGTSLLDWQWSGYERPDGYLKGLLDAGYLVVSDDVKEAVAYLAASFVCERQMTWDGNDPFKSRRNFYYTEWRKRLSTLSGAVAVDATATNVLYFNMSTISTR